MISINEINRLANNHYSYLTNNLPDNLIISRIDNPNFKDNKVMAFKIEDKGLNNELTFFQLSMRLSVTKYFQVIKTEKSVILIRK